MAQQFGHIFKPLQLKHTTLRNRIVMGAWVRVPASVASGHPEVVDIAMTPHALRGPLT